MNEPTETSVDIDPSNGMPWWESVNPRPCPCGSVSLQHIITDAPEKREYEGRHSIIPGRMAVQCRNCGKMGPDTCHGGEHANRRWNWMIEKELSNKLPEEERPMTWCPDCRSYHVEPDTYQTHRRLQCFAPYIAKKSPHWIVAYIAYTILVGACAMLGMWLASFLYDDQTSRGNQFLLRMAGSFLGAGLFVAWNLRQKKI